MTVEELQQLVCRHLSGAPKGAANELALEAGIAKGTLSRIRNGLYTANVGSVSDRLQRAIANRAAADAIASGQYRLVWLVRTRRDIRIVKQMTTVERLRRRFPDAHIVQLWCGPEPSDLHFVTSLQEG